MLLLSLQSDILIDAARESALAVSAAALEAYPYFKTLDVKQVTAARELFKSITVIEIS